MQPESRVFHENGNFVVDIVDLDDILEHGGNVLPELLLTLPKSYTREGPAERAGDASAKRIADASESERRRIIGLDPSSQCGTPSVSVGYRARRRKSA